jgi:hypothetical protein
MPVGQFTGSRQTYIYVADDNNSYLLKMDETLGSIDGAGNVVATIANSGDAQNKPVGFQPRGVYWEATAAPIGARKFIVCGDRADDLYSAETSQALTIDGVAGITTGRRGERFTYTRLSA